MKTCPNCGELVGDNSDKCFKCQFDFKTMSMPAKKVSEPSINYVQNQGDKYTYKVECVTDHMNGETSVVIMQSILDKYSAQGWRLVSCFANELGHNAVRVGALGTNSTVAEVVLVFEKKIQ